MNTTSSAGGENYFLYLHWHLWLVFLFDPQNYIQRQLLSYCLYKKNLSLGLTINTEMLNGNTDELKSRGSVNELFFLKKRKRLSEIYSPEYNPTKKTVKKIKFPCC